MQFRTTFLHMDRSEAIEAFAAKKIGAKIERLSQSPTSVHVTFLVEKDQHIVKLSLQESGTDDVALQSQNGDMYAAINKLADQLDKLLRRKKDKRIRGRVIDKETKLEKFTPAVEEAIEA
ncbi:MAG: ribosome-associated translation inhibitor RaiA [Pseudobacteriovorax sp.]|nr:ribosome-associated translation inhibitor RaiA [Pseudobacteriovorax sp.]